MEASTAVKPGHFRRIEIGGTRGSAALTEDTITEWQIMDPMPDVGEKWNMDTANDPTAVDATGHLLQMSNLLAAVEGKEQLISDAEEGCRTVEVILGIYESARSGNTVNFSELAGPG